MTTSKGPRINGRQCRPYVQGRKPFHSNGQLYAVWTTAGVLSPGDDGAPTGMRYVVFSYGEHWPLHIWDDASQRWYSNAVKYSTTTSRHHAQSHPHCDTTPLPLMAMRLLAREGYPALVAARLAGTPFANEV